MNILITGGAGFIGSHITDYLVSKNHSIEIIDDLSTGRIDNIFHLFSNFETDVICTQKTIADREIVHKIFNRHHPDIVIHAAASYKDPLKWHNDTDTNTLGMINLITNSLEHKVKRFIYFQTALCYGLNPPENPITLTCPVNPSGSSYAISKTAAEYYLAMSGLNFISFRMANIFGPRNLSGPIPTFYKRIREGLPCTVVDTRRDFVYIQDLIDLLKIAIFDYDKQGYYHVSHGTDYSILELYDCVCKSLGVEPRAVITPRKPDDAATICLDPSATNKDFGWHPYVGLQSGILKAIEWYKDNQITETYTHLKLEK